MAERLLPQPVVEPQPLIERQALAERQPVAIEPLALVERQPVAEPAGLEAVVEEDTENTHRAISTTFSSTLAFLQE